MIHGIPRLGQEPLTVPAPDDDDERFWSVTTIIGALDKPALVPWAAKATAEAAVDELEAWRSRLVNEGRESAVKYLTGSRFRTRHGLLSASELGTVAHGLFERYALTGVRPPITGDLHPRSHDGMTLTREDTHTLARMLDQFERWCAEFCPVFEATEVAVFNLTYGYAGTLDAIISLDGRPLVLDYKTSRESFDWKGNNKGPYPEVALQLAAYRFAEIAAVWRARRFERNRRRYYLLNEAERAAAVPMPDVDGGVALYVTPEFAALHPVRCGPDVFDAFLFVQESARWSFQLAGRAVGAPMNPPHPIVANGDPFAGLST